MVPDILKSIFGSQKWLWFHIWVTATLYYKMRQLFYNKMQQKFITKCFRVLLQNPTVLFQNAIVIGKCNNFFTKCENHYQMEHLLQNALVQGVSR